MPWRNTKSQKRNDSILMKALLLFMSIFAGVYYLMRLIQWLLIIINIFKDLDDELKNNSRDPGDVE